MGEEDTTINTTSVEKRTVLTSQSWVRGGLIVFAISVIIAASAGLLYWKYGQSPTEHLIQGVPYWGSYEGTEITTAGAFVTYSMLQYWGDNRFTTKQIANKFPTLIQPQSNITYDNVSAFFEENGYEVTTSSIDNIDALKELLQGDVPVIVSQRITTDTPTFVKTMRLFIGYSDKDQSFVVHDNNFGNNYDIPYIDFQKLEEGTNMTVLVVKPKPEINSLTSGPDTTYQYPKRLGIMDSTDIRDVQIKLATIGSLEQLSGEQTREIATLWEEIVNNKGFDELHPAMRMIASYSLARTYTHNLQEHQKAIDVLEKVTIPLLKYDFSQPFGEWKRNSPEVYKEGWWKISPWLTLGVVYMRLGENENATNTFAKAKELDPEHPVVKAFFNGTLDPSNVSQYYVN